MCEKKHCIYKHTNKANGKVYIGQTCNPKARFSDEKYKKCTHFYRALQKYGKLKDAFETSILADNLTLEEANELEIKYIAEYKSTNPEFGYNLCVGGQGGEGCDHTEQWKREHSARMTGSGNPNYGKHWDEEHRKILSEKHMGIKRKKPQEEIDKIRETHRNMKHYNDKCVRCINTDETFNSQRECARVLKEKTGMKFRGCDIGLVCRGKLKTTHGYTFEYA